MQEAGRGGAVRARPEMQPLTLMEFNLYQQEYVLRSIDCNVIIWCLVVGDLLAVWPVLLPPELHQDEHLQHQAVSLTTRQYLRKDLIHIWLLNTPLAHQLL